MKNKRTLTANHPTLGQIYKTPAMLNWARKPESVNLFDSLRIDIENVNRADLLAIEIHEIQTREARELARRRRAAYDTRKKQHGEEQKRGEAMKRGRPLLAKTKLCEHPHFGMLYKTEKMSHWQIYSGQIDIDEDTMDDVNHKDIPNHERIAIEIQWLNSGDYELFDKLNYMRENGYSEGKIKKFIDKHTCNK